jgi:hypothetical protein
MTQSERDHYMTLHQQVLPFDFWQEEEAEAKAEIQSLPYYDEPTNDNERLFNLQKEYYGGRESALTETFTILNEVAPKLINIEMNKHAKTKRYFTQDVIDDMAMDATCLFINQIKKNHLIIRTSFVAYLRLQVLKVMNNRTKAQRFEEFCRKNHVNLFYLSDDEKALFKLKFEEELLEEKAKAIKERQETI